MCLLSAEGMLLYKYATLNTCLVGYYALMLLLQTVSLMIFQIIAYYISTIYILNNISQIASILYLFSPI